MDTSEDSYKGTQGQRPYAGAGWYYAEYRGRASQEFIRLLAENLGWASSDRILDLGAGPGHLSMLVAPLVSEVIAIEPEPDMLAEGEKRVRDSGINNVRFIPASSDELTSLGFPQDEFRSALMGRSFHWMVEKDRVLRDLSSIVDKENGSVAFISQYILSIPPALQEIRDAVRKILETFLVTAPRGPHPDGRHDPFEEILARSAFTRVERIQLDYSLAITPTFASIVGNEYTYSYVLSRLGDRRAKFEQDVELALGKQIEQLGEVRLMIRDEALLGRRG